ncbi:TOR complex subunit lst8 [Mycoemilia scoparia]|uniref:TOR complex subunit lst8 n=1 Tax=Mycoemilia scoparia TaxID=417184 RepID=A0A9W8A8R9_9FUNG|nr:TOR complex subunit lst8 [Mycoemilia scoparia]
MALSSDKRYLAVAGNPTIRLYDVFGRGDTPILTLERNKGNITSVQFTSDVRWLVSGSDNKSICWWDLRAGVCRRDIKNDSAVNDIAIYPNPNMEFVASCDQDGYLKFWGGHKALQAASGNAGGSGNGGGSIGSSGAADRPLCQVVPELEVSLRSVSISPDGTLVAVGNSLGRVFIYQLKFNTAGPKSSGNGGGVRMILVHSFDAHSNGKFITRVVFSANCQFLATCSSDKTAMVWRIKQTKRNPNNSDDPDKYSTPSKESDDHADGTPHVEVEDVNEDTEGEGDFDDGLDPDLDSPAESEEKPDIEVEVTLIHKLKHHKRWVWDAAFSNDSGYLVTVSTDQIAALWRISDGALTREFKGHSRGISCVALNDATLSSSLAVRASLLFKTTLHLLFYHLLTPFTLSFELYKRFSELLIFIDMSYSTTSMPSHIAGGNNVISPTSIPSSQPGGGGGAVPKPHAKAPTTGSSLGKVVNRPKGPIKNPLLNKHKQQQPFGLASPTDKMLSPITRKLAEKRKQNLAG